MLYGRHPRRMLPVWRLVRNGDFRSPDADCCNQANWELNRTSGTAPPVYSNIKRLQTMANWCENRLYCSTDNWERVIYFLDKEFELSELDGRENFIHARFCSRWTFPEDTMERLTTMLNDDPTLYIEVISFEPGMGYLEAHIFQRGKWGVIP